MAETDALAGLNEDQVSDLIADGAKLAQSLDPRLQAGARNALIATEAKPAAEDKPWRNDNPDLICARQLALIVYQNEFGQAVIRQEADWNEDDDSYVFISKHHLQDVIDRLQAILHDDK